MNIKFLTLEDLPEIERIFYANISVEETRNNYSINNNRDASLIPALFDSMVRWYLNPNDNQHIALGVEENNKLLVYIGIRFDLPGKYSKGWNISWIKGDPAVNLIKTGTLKLLWNFMIPYVESLGKTCWYIIATSERQGDWDAFSRRITPDIDSRYSWKVLHQIPPGEKPPEDWMFAAMGRTVKENETWVVKEGTLKNE